MELGYAEGDFTRSLDALKQQVFGRTDFVLHRRDIINKELEPFTALRDGKLRRTFDEKLLELIKRSEYRCITAHIDKKEHRERYIVWRYFVPFQK